MAFWEKKTEKGNLEIVKSYRLTVMPSFKGVEGSNINYGDEQGKNIIIFCFLLHLEEKCVDLL